MTTVTDDDQLIADLRRAAAHVRRDIAMKRSDDKPLAGRLERVANDLAFGRVRFRLADRPDGGPMTDTPPPAQLVAAQLVADLRKSARDVRFSYGAHNIDADQRAGRLEALAGDLERARSEGHSKVCLDLHARHSKPRTARPL